MICHSFPPVYAPQARVLIVGSMPSVKSLADAQYYAHPRNAFWPILFDVFGRAPCRDYEEKKRLIRENRLALWDAAATCCREGSLDSSMREIEFNDFSQLFEACPGIHTVLCNGSTAHALFLKSGHAGERTIVRLPSTSPAYTMPYAKKLAAWKETIERALSMIETKSMKGQGDKIPCQADKGETLIASRTEQTGMMPATLPTNGGKASSFVPEADASQRDLHNTRRENDA